jgi:hypothetical protein
MNLTNYMSINYLLIHKGPFWKDERHTSGQEIPYTYLNLKVHHYVHKSLLLGPTLSHMTPVHSH